MTKRIASRRGSAHYLEMKIQPIEIFDSLGMRYEWAVCTAIKYLMRQGDNSPDDPRVGAEEDLKKAQHCIELALEALHG